jgi:hypothetical protein
MHVIIGTKQYNRKEAPKELKKGCKEICPSMPYPRHP